MSRVAIVGGRLLIQGELNEQLKLLPALVKVDEAILRMKEVHDTITMIAQ